MTSRDEFVETEFELLAIEKEKKTKHFLEWLDGKP